MDEIVVKKRLINAIDLELRSSKNRVYLIPNPYNGTPLTNELARFFKEALGIKYNVVANRYAVEFEDELTKIAKERSINHIQEAF